jgi:hypothetical protein
LTDTNGQDANVMAAYFAATRLVWAELTPAEIAGEDAHEAALADLWTGNAEDDEERAGLLIEALVEYAAILARRASPSAKEASLQAYEEAWKMVPDHEAGLAFARGTLAAVDEMIARHAGLSES